MLTNHQIYHRRAIATFTTSRLIDTAPRHLARALQHPWLFRPPAAEPQRPSPIAIDLNPAPNRCGALTLHSQCGGISERRPLRTRHAASARLTAAADDAAALPEGDATPALALTIELTPQIQPGPTIATRVTLSVHFVREPWWPNDLTDALDALADLWLRRFAEQANATAPDHQTFRYDGATRPGPSTFSHRSRHR